MILIAYVEKGADGAAQSRELDASAPGLARERSSPCVESKTNVDRSAATS